MAAISKADAEKALREAFKAVDTDNSGSISAKELETILLSYYKSKGKPCDQAKVQKEAQAFLDEVDKNHDHQIELEEFLSYFMQFFTKC